MKGLFRYWREDLSFGGKLLSSFAVLLVAFAVPLPLSYVLVRDSADQADAARRAIQVMQQVIHVEHDLGELRSAASDYAARPTASRRELLDDARAAAVQRVRSIPASSRSQRKRVDTVVDGIDSSVAQLQADVRDSDPDTAMLDFNTAVRFDIQRDAVELADEAQSVAVGRHVLLAERTREHLMRIVALLAAALVFAVVIGLAVPRLVVARLFLLRGTTRRLTAGDLASRADIAGRDELAQLGADFDALAVSLERRESENQALLARERDRALRDSLTGLYNRGYFDEAFAGELARAGRRQGFVSVAIIDLDDFKRLNDTLGHLRGDAVLKAFAECLVQTLRPYDIACRLGGEEFGLILPETSPDQAVSVLRRLAARGPALIDDWRVTFSCGVAGFPQHARGATQLVEMADAATYLAKERGKNQVVVAPSSPDEHDVVGIAAA